MATAQSIIGVSPMRAFNPTHKPLTDEWTPFYEVVRPRRQVTLRDKVEAYIERLIAMFDTLDGDSDFEPSLDGRAQMLRDGTILDDCEEVGIEA